MPSVRHLLNDTLTSEIAGNTCRYELYGVVAHGGHLTSSGHYIAYIRADPLSDVTASTKLGWFRVALSVRMLSKTVTSILIDADHVRCAVTCVKIKM